MQAHPLSTGPWGNRARRWAPMLIGIGALAAFLVTRLPNLDADVPEWAISQYSPIDEFGYTVPAFNLHHYGTWVHRAAAWAPVEGWPMNIVQNVVAAASIQFLGYTYWGLRASSVLFGLIAFLALAALAWQQAVEARRVDGIPAWLAFAVTTGAGVLLLADFSSLLSARVIEPTVTRLAGAALLVVLVSRGAFLGDRHGPLRSAVLGAFVAAMVLFVYVYNLFLLPAVLVTLGWWARRNGGWPSFARHSTAFLIGIVLASTVYFALVHAVYGQTPVDWYRVWIGYYENTTRATGASVGKALSILDANVFRLDPAFLGLFLVSLPVFAWWVARRRSAWGVLVVVGLAFLVAQSAFVADYPHRKFLMIMLFALPVAAGGALHGGAFRDWLVERRPRVITAGAWLALALVVTLLQAPLRPVPSHGATLALVIQVAGVAGVVAIAIVAAARRRAIVTFGACALGLAVLAPLLYADWTFVYRRPTFTYRDALVDVRGIVDEQVTAGAASFGMQLYNTSRPVLNGFFFGLTPQEYERDVVRLFAEGLATSMFNYVTPTTRAHWEALGFRVVDTYAILLPRGETIGRYVFGPPASADPP